MIYISEFTSVATDIGKVPLVPMPPVTEQTIPPGTPSAPFGAGTMIIRVNTDATCSIKISHGPPAVGASVATTANLRMPANSTEYFAVRPGSVLTAIGNS